MSDDKTPTERPSRNGTGEFTLPRKRGARGKIKDIAGIPVAGEDEDTDRHNLRAIAANDPLSASSSGKDPLSQLIDRIVSEVGGGGSGGIPPSQHKAEIKRHNWITALVITLLGSGGVFASYYATEARTKQTAVTVDKLEPRVIKNSQDVQYIKARIEMVGSDVTVMKAQQGSISAGIEQLKEESIKDREKRLQEKVDRLERENRRLERRIR